MPNQPNLALNKFIRDFAPDDADDCWGLIVVARLAHPREDLPANRDALDHDLAVLKAMRYVGEDGRGWSLKYPQPVERVIGQQELFA